jgi:uncharacterized protein YdhG (YjbR/CyaY superfamily)
LHESRRRLRELGDIIRAAALAASNGFSYGMLAFKLDGQTVV